jgi:predicted nucleic acid-binding protein
MFTFDTNTLIYYFQGRKSTVDFVKEHKFDLFFIPSIVITEFLSYPLISKETEKLFLELVKSIIIINLDLEIAQHAGYLRRKYKIKTVDAVIASSAILTNTTLLTYNIEDFKKIKEVKIISP